MIYDRSLYPAVARRMRSALHASGFEAEAAAVDQCLRTSVTQAIEVGWKLLYLHDIQYFMSFEEELLSFGCVSLENDETLYQAARHMLEDYMDKNADRVDEFIGGYHVGCSIAMTETNDELAGYRKGGGGRRTSAIQPSLPLGTGRGRSSSASSSSVSASTSSLSVSPLPYSSSASSSSSPSSSALSSSSASEQVSGQRQDSRPHSQEPGYPRTGEVKESAGSGNPITMPAGGPANRRKDLGNPAMEDSATKNPRGEGNPRANGPVRKGAAKRADVIPPVGTLLTYRQDLREAMRHFEIEDKARLRQERLLRRMDRPGRPGRTA